MSRPRYTNRYSPPSRPWPRRLTRPRRRWWRSNLVNGAFFMIFLACLMVAGAIKESLGDVAGFLGGGASGRVNGGGAHLIDQVTRVRDGDTIVVGLIPIRISALDCDEAGSVAGDRATARMRGIVQGQTLTCKLEGRRSYDREVGSCALPDGHDIAELMIRDGYCARW